MARKCVPGTICIENLTFVIVLILILLVGYLYYIFLTKPVGYSQMEIVVPPQMNLNVASNMTSNTTPNIMMDPYVPPLRTDGGYLQGKGGIPVNIETRGLQQDYTQLGIITREGNKDMILPLMGRRLIVGLDKWQYYTISNTGAINTKLPIRYHGRNCSGEYGCDSLMNGDIVYVEGYQDIFRVTLYETAKFQYIPYI